MGIVWVLPEDAQEYGRVFDAWLKATGEATVFAGALKDLLLADILADRGVDVDGVRRRGPRPVGGDAAAGPFEGAYGDGSRRMDPEGLRAPSVGPQRPVRAMGLSRGSVAKGERLESSGAQSELGRSWDSSGVAGEQDGSGLVE